ncbi:jg17745 [Pararge aegeria aegeria]|uniref:Jg17745 protein n=1 Tax=Pararge aegeria aegeria TaxID=348720 RepID=A0A8S4S7W1_9NEOP|nr:jg17745 [Pararge aegeria aegeria]
MGRYDNHILHSVAFVQRTRQAGPPFRRSRSRRGCTEVGAYASEQRECVVADKLSNGRSGVDCGRIFEL